MKKNLFGLYLGLCTVSLISTASAFSYPSQVKGVKVIPISETSVQASWDEATSAEDIIIGYRIYYGVNSVQDADAVYDDDMFVSGDRTAVIENLEPGTDYYFAVTALDSEENESERYSVEKKVTTLGEKYVEPEPEPEPTCDDGILNGNEEDTDCGGGCAPCYTEPEPTCDDGILNGSEEEIDCGGDMCDPCVTPEPEITEEVETEIIEEPEIFGPEVPEHLKPAAPDVIAPIEATQLSVDVSRIDKESIVTLNWIKSPNINGDVADQVLYVRKNMGSWDDGYSIGKDLESTVLDIEKGAIYEYKIITLDEAGNESESSVYSFSTELVKAGPAGALGIAVAIFMFFGLGSMAIRRKL